jgi:apolipoprotein N-acyltransferase
VLCEWIRTQFWFGVPWGRLSLGQLMDGVPYSVLSSSIFGTYFVTFLIVVISCLIAQALIVGKFKLRVILSMALVISNLLCGVIIASIPRETKSTVKVAAIQANINSRDKWNASSKDIYLKYESLTRNAAKDGAELIVCAQI